MILKSELTRGLYSRSEGCRITRVIGQYIPWDELPSVVSPNPAGHIRPTWWGFGKIPKIISPRQTYASLGVRTFAVIKENTTEKNTYQGVCYHACCTVSFPHLYSPHLARARESPSKTSSSPSSLHVEHKDMDKSRSRVRPLDDSPLHTELAPPVELAVLPTSLSVLAAASRSSCLVVVERNDLTSVNVKTMATVQPHPHASYFISNLTDHYKTYVYPVHRTL